MYHPERRSSDILDFFRLGSSDLGFIMVVYEKSFKL